MSYRIPFVILFLLSCGRISNQHADDLIRCGDDLPRSQAFFTVADSRNNPMSAGFEIIDLESETPLPIVSRNGCVAIPEAGNLLIRSLATDEARIVSVPELKDKSEVSLLDYSRDHLSVDCSTDTRTVGPNFSPAELLKVNVQENLIPAYRLHYDINGLHSGTSFGLTDARNLRPLASLANEEVYEMTLTVSNLLKRRESQNACRLNLDRTVRDIGVYINARPPTEFIEVHGTRDIITVGLNDALTFHSDEAVHIRYCVVPLDDDFEKVDSEAGRAWAAVTTANDCHGQEVLEALPNAPILSNIKSRFWSLRYQAVDTVGNATDFHSRTLLVLNRDAQRAIQDRALLALTVKSSWRVVENALTAENLRLKLPTRYERFATRDASRSALLRAYYQESVALVLPPVPNDNTDALALSHSGKYLATLSSNQILKLIDITSGQVLWSMNAGVFSRSIVFARDDSQILLLHKAIKIFDTSDGRFIRELPGETDAYALLGPSADGSQLWMWSPIGIEARSMASGLVLHTVPLTENSLVTANLSPDGQYLALLSDQGQLRIWDAQKGIVIQSIESQTCETCTMAWSRDNQVLAILNGTNDANDKNEIVLFERKNAHWKAGSVLMEDRATKIALSNDGKTLFIANSLGEVKARTVDHPNPVFRTLSEQNDSVDAFFVPAQGSRLVTYSRDDKLRIWNLDLMRARQVLTPPDRDSTAAVVVSPDGSKLIGATANHGAIVWDLKSGGILHELPELNADFSSSLDVSQDGKILMLKTSEAIQLWNLETGKPIRRLELTNFDHFHSASLSSDGKFVVAGLFDSEDVRIWDVTQQGEPRRFGVGTNINTVALDSTGQLLATCGRDHTIKLWDLVSGESVGRLEGHGTAAQHLKFSEDGTKLTSLDWYSIKVWDLKTKLAVLEHKGQFRGQEFIDVSNDGHLMIAGGQAAITLWDRAWETPLHVPMQDFYASLAIAEDGLSFATVTTDGRIQIWDLDHGAIRRNLCDRLGSYLEAGLCPLQ